jgi:hypothetical protein
MDHIINILNWLSEKLRQLSCDICLVFILCTSLLNCEIAFSCPQTMLSIPNKKEGNVLNKQQMYLSNRLIHHLFLFQSPHISNCNRVSFGVYCFQTRLFFIGVIFNSNLSGCTDAAIKNNQKSQLQKCEI